ncbi:MAG: DUF1015 domain-containing protein [Clostridia bacterium]|nr:DUF1015 domain-containing protein [Clostridia bacterium]
MKPVRSPKLLLPNENVDPSKWSVVACDQFTSEPEYWAELREFIGDSPSTLDLIYPEAYIGKSDFESEVDCICRKMKEYCEKGLFVSHDGYVLCKRTMSNGKVRTGLIAEIDLEAYDPFGSLQIRATEKTVRERLPLRMRIRRDAVMELPHILILLDDPDKKVIEVLSDKRKAKLYSFPLNMNGGYLEGYALDTDDVDRAFASLESSREGRSSFYLAVGDGNHSLAAARECWLAIKDKLGEEEKSTHPARFALVEIVNLFEDSLSFEPIHRVVTGVGEEFVKNFPSDDEGREITLFVRGEKKAVKLKGTSPEIIARIQNYLDAYIASHDGAKQDYIHGYENLLRVSREGVGILMPAIEKETMFSYIEKNGVLTRKAFSMGEAVDKRYYYESRFITPATEE